MALSMLKLAYFKEKIRTIYGEFDAKSIRHMGRN